MEIDRVRKREKERERERERESTRMYYIRENSHIGLERNVLMLLYEIFL